MWYDVLPAVNASLNALSGVLLLLGYFFIRRGDQKKHIACMISAVALGALFLVCYVTHHVARGGIHTPFPYVGWLKTSYYAMLISHVLLAMSLLPAVIVILRHAAKGNFDRHRAIARWVFPVWVYVSVTGVLVYVALYQFPKWVTPTAAPNEQPTAVASETEAL
jgi:uncharacterized membrane protein YozB (DUF420 family)